MNSEENRLRSFSSWPSNAALTPSHLAKNGFFATNNYLEAECNWCHLRIREWCLETVEEKHRLEQPRCPLLLHNSNCGNVPLRMSSNIDASSVQPSSSSARPSRDLFVEANRLATFKNWPNTNISPSSLAKAGFFYLNRSDEVKCVWCKGMIGQWEKNDNAFEEHRKFFPNCPQVQFGPMVEVTSSNSFRDLGIQHISPPKKPDFALLDARLRTYDKWPISHVQQPEALAQAGLYYLDVDDQVRCFHCNIGLHSWQKEDDPWFEHAKWCPQCQFVHLVKGVGYVQQVQDLNRQSGQSNSEAAFVMNINDAMKTTAVLQAMEMGIDAGSIRNVTQRQLLITGQPFDKVEDLVKAVFDDRLEESDAQDSENMGERTDSNASTVRKVSRIIKRILGSADEESISSSERIGCQREILASSISLPTSTSIRDGKNNSTTNVVSTNAHEDSIIESGKKNTLKCHDVQMNRSLSLEEENRKLKDARCCKVCLDVEVGVVFLPCGHLVTCVQCAPLVNQCPMCRSAISGIVRTFLS